MRSMTMSTRYQERQAFRGLSGPPEQPFLRSILARACEYAGGHWKARTGVDRWEGF